MQCRIDLDAASSASLTTSDCNFLAYGPTRLRQGASAKVDSAKLLHSRRMPPARKTATGLPHLDAADSVRMAAEYKQIDLKALKREAALLTCAQRDA
jgi:hypothetical protein